jgi:hypothetical protein
MCEITKYNNSLVDSKTIINIIDYVKAINKLKYNIDIDFIDEFIELVDKDECCIHHKMLQKYGILSLNKGSTHIKRILEQNEFEENIDFRLSNVGESAPKGGCTHKKEYFLHPRAFKICLMRSLKNKQYARYYILLEECIKYFNEYQIELNKRYNILLKEKIQEKDNKISNLEEKLDNIISTNKELLLNNKEILNKHDTLLSENKEILLNNKELLSENKEIKDILKKNQLKLDKTFDKLVGVNEELIDVKYKLDDTNDKLDDTNEELEIIKDKLDIATDDRVIKTKNNKMLEYLIILKTDDENEYYTYYIVRCQKRAIKQRLEYNPNYSEIKRIECVPNSTNLFNRIKEKLKNNLKIKSNRINLININETDFLDKIDLINDEKKII